MKVHSILTSCFLLFFPLFTCAQSYPTRYWIQFTDKTNTPYSISNPSAFLSQKAIDRRVDQGIAIQQNDLPVDPAYVNSVRSVGVTVLNKSKWFNGITIYTEDSTLLDSIYALSFVSKVDTIGKQSPQIGLEQDKINKKNKWDLEESSLTPLNSLSVSATDYGQAYDQISMVDGDILHGLGYKGEGITIAVIDAGFDNADTNPAFDSAFTNNQVLGTWDFVDGNDSVYDNGPHGLWVFSIMASNIPGLIVGTAPKANYWLLRTEDTNSEYLVEEDNWVAAAEFADSAGADILTTSLGYKTFDDSLQNHTYADMDGNTTRITNGGDIAAGKGMLVINAAGNAGSSNWKYIVAPADGDSILAIGAVDVAEQIASFSSQGPSADGRVKPNVAAMGSGTVTITSSGGVQSGGGTSFACPVIAGMAACLWGANPTATSMEVFEAIQQSADQYNNPDNLKGHGIPKFAMANVLLSGGNLMADADGDGVLDISDKCPGTPYPAMVDEDGCPVEFVISEFIENIENPISENLYFLYYSSVSQQLDINLYDMRGRKVYSDILSLAAASYTDIYLTGIGGISQGVYILKINSGGNSVERKLLKR